MILVKIGRLRKCATQMVGPGPKALVSPRSLLELEKIRPTPNLDYILTRSHVIHLYINA